MTRLDQAIIAKILEAPSKGPAVTMYVPTHSAPTSPNMTEDQIRFKNMYRKVVEILHNRDKHDEFNTFFIEQCEQRLDERTFWEGLSNSMLVCARPGFFEVITLPVDTEEYVAVDEHFHLAPVYGLLADMHEYNVLTVSRQEPALFKGSAYGLEETDVDLPASIEQALQIDEMHLRSVQHHRGAGTNTRSASGAHSGNGSGKAMFHGHGGSKDTGDAERKQFWRILDTIVMKHIDTSLPLLLVGVETEVHEYMDLNKHPSLIDAQVYGSFDKHSLNELRQPVQASVRTHIIERNHQDALSTFDRLHGQSPERADDEFAAIKDAAEKGRVETLLIGMARFTRDTVRDNLQRVPKLVFPSEKQSQAMDYVAQHVWRQSGKIITLYQDQMPKNKLLLSINRY